MRRSLTKGERLKRSSDIGRVFASGRKVSCYGAKLFYRENGRAGNRMTVTLVRKYGTAVERNRAKRVVREAYRLMKPSLKKGYDMIVVLYPHIDTCHNRAQQLARLCEKAGLLCGAPEEGVHGDSGDSVHAD
jgi:ribonuclease P protein component